MHVQSKAESVLAEEFESLNEVGGEEQASHERVTSVKFKRQQINALRLVARFVGKEDFHLVFVVRSALEFPSANVEGLKAAQICQDQRRLTQHEGEWERHAVEEG